ncbi:hypothetical protein IFR05_005538 [Cadophora sp. M221]|nr:hypothetical protein IFR05_005538 [Cadophora sp. M221]
MYQASNSAIRKMQFKIVFIATALATGVLALPNPDLANEDFVLNPEVPEIADKRDFRSAAGVLGAREKYFEGGAGGGIRGGGSGFRNPGAAGGAKGGSGSGGKGGSFQRPPPEGDPPCIPHNKRGFGTLFGRSTDPVC